MEPVTTDPKGEGQSQLANTSALAIKIRSTKILDPIYVTGFTDGEGSFLVSFNRREKLMTGLEVRPSFSLSQHERSRKILSHVQRFFGCGSIRYDRHDQTYKYEVRSLDDLWERIIPHFVSFPLQTAKRNDFETFMNICSLMRMSKHRTRQGIEKIMTLAYSMNNLGARRFEFRDLLKIVSKMKV